jgi:hypothetical protein
VNGIGGNEPGGALLMKIPPKLFIDIEQMIIHSFSK